MENETKIATASNQPASTHQYTYRPIVEDFESENELFFSDSDEGSIATMSDHDRVLTEFKDIENKTTPPQIFLIGNQWKSLRKDKKINVEEIVNDQLNKAIWTEDNITERDAHPYTVINNEDNNEKCKVCRQSTPQISVDYHLKLGGFAKGHCLGTLTTLQQTTIALNTLTKMKDNKILCKICEEGTQAWGFNTRHQQHVGDMYHILAHGHILGANPSKMQAMKFANNSLHYCGTCNMVFPTKLSLIIHTWINSGHQRNTTIYCTDCRRFLKRTTVLAHQQNQHAYDIVCPSCPHLKKLHINEVLTHMCTTVHQNIDSMMQKEITDKQIDILNLIRNRNHMGLTNPIFNMKIICLQNNLVHEANQLGQMNICQFILISSEHFFPTKLGQEINSKQTEPQKANLKRLLRDMQNRNSNYTSEIELMSYDICTACIYKEVEIMLATAYDTPQEQQLCLYNDNNQVYPGIILMPPSFMVNQEEPISLELLKMIDVVTVGNHALRQTGTNLDQGFSILNLSTNTQNSWPTHFYTTTPTTIEGAILIQGREIKYLPENRNYMRHIETTLRKIRTNLPIIIEFSITGFLNETTPEEWAKFLDQNLATIVAAFFTGLHRIREKVANEIGIKHTLLVLGQCPFQAKHKIKPKKLVSLWEQINVVSFFFARITRTLYLPTTALVSYGTKIVANTLVLTGRTFEPDGELTLYTRHQVIVLLQIFVKIVQTMQEWRALHKN